VSNGYEDHARAARDWWRRLQPDPQGTRPGDPATLARLRRAASAAQALAEAETLRLWASLGVEHRRLARVGTVARVLAHVRRAADAQRRGALARSLGPTAFGKDETARLKRLRFERLLATREEEELARAMIRLVQLAGRETPIDVGDLAASILAWDAEATRIAWAFAYHDPSSPPAADAVAAPEDAA
jgi:CRISPR system Cascade subunit CasB